MARVPLSLSLLVGVFCVCTGKESREKPDLSDEKHKLSADRTDGSDEIPIVQLDKELREEIKNPTPLQDSFEVQLKVLKQLVNFYNRLKDLYAGVLKDTTSKLTVAKTLIEKSGPDFIKEAIDEDKLRQVYNWDGGNLEFFRDYMQDIKDVWNNITLVIKGKPTPTNLQR